MPKAIRRLGRSDGRTILSDAEFSAREGAKRAALKVRRAGKRQKLRAEYVLEHFLAEARASGIRGRFLEVGCGNGAHVDHVRSLELFESVTCIDVSREHEAPHHLRGTYEDYRFAEPFDAIWTSHVLEHTRNPGAFLDKLHRDLREGGLLAISVPPLKHGITVGHVSLWTPGLLLLNLVKSGFDCSGAAIRQQGYNIGVVLRKRTCPKITSFTPREDGSARPYLPKGLSWFQNPRTKLWYFRGNFISLNWR